MATRKAGWWVILDPPDWALVLSLLQQEADGLEHDRRFDLTEGLRQHVADLRRIADRILAGGSKKV